MRRRDHVLVPVLVPGLVARLAQCLVPCVLTGLAAPVAAQAAPALPAAAAEPAPSAANVSVRFGRVVDVYVRGPAGDASSIERHAAGVLVAPALPEAPGEGCTRLPCNPRTGRARLLIDREPGTAAFTAVWQRLAASAPVLGHDAPRDAAFRIAPLAPETGTVDVGDVRLVARGDGAPIACRVTGGADGTLVEPACGAAGMPAGPVRLQCRAAGRDAAFDFHADDSLPDSEPPRLVGELVVRLERVARVDERTRVLTLFLGGVRQALRSGDVAVVRAAGGRPVGEWEVLDDVPAAAADAGRRAHVRVRVDPGASGRRAADELTALAAASLPGFPPRGGPARDAFVAANAPPVTLVTLFDAARGDELANFVRIGDRDVADTRGNGVDVSPHAAFDVRFSVPLDLASLHAGLQLAATTGVVPMRLHARDDTDRSFRLTAPLGLSLTPERRAELLAERERPVAERRTDYVLTVLGGATGVRARSGVRLPATATLGVILDPAAPDNVVAWRTVPLR
jgi:hypothetical protein